MREPDYSILARLRSPSLKHFPRTSIIGQTFGHLFVFARLGYDRRRVSFWLCRCSCKNWSIVNRNKLQRGLTGTCGCGSAVNRTHGMRFTRVYGLWTDMLTRVRNPRVKNQHRYIGRGICACQGLHRFENFYKLLGDPPTNQSTDRINNNGHYSCGDCEECLSKNWPMNVKWSTSKEQNRNRENNRLITIGDQVKCLSEWAEKGGVQTSTAWFRLDRGWTPAQAFGFEKPPSRKRVNCQGP